MAAISDTLAKLFVEVGVDTTKAHSGLATFKGDLQTIFTGLGGILQTALGPIGATLAAAFAIKDMVEAFMEGELAATALASALESNGQEVEKNVEKFNELALAIQSATRIDDEGVLDLITKGLNLGLPASEMDKFTKAAIGLGTALKIDVESAMQALAKEAQGVESNLNRSIPALKGVEDQSQRLAIIAGFAAKGLAQEEASAGTLSGKITILWNAIGNLAESLGSILAPVVGWAVDVFMELAGVLQNMLDVVLGGSVDLSDFGTMMKDNMFRPIRLIGQYFMWLAPVVVNVWGSILGALNWAASGVLDFTNKVWTYGIRLPDVFYKFADAVVSVFTTVGGWLSWLGGKIAGFFQWAIGGVGSFIDEFTFRFLNLDLVFREVALFVLDFVYAIDKFFNGALSMAASFVSWFASGFVSAFQAVFMGIANFVGTWGKAILGVFGVTMKGISQSLADTIAPINATVAASLRAVKASLPEFKIEGSFDGGKTRKELDAEWGRRRKEWDSIVRADPLVPHIEPPETLPIVKAPAPDKKEKEKDKSASTAVGQFGALGSAWTRINGDAAKREEKRLAEAQKVRKQQLDEIKGLRGDVQGLNLGLK